MRTESAVDLAKTQYSSTYVEWNCRMGAENCRFFSEKWPNSAMHNGFIPKDGSDRKTHVDCFDQLSVTHIATKLFSISFNLQWDCLDQSSCYCCCCFSSDFLNLIFT